MAGEDDERRHANVCEQSPWPGVMKEWGWCATGAGSLHSVISVLQTPQVNTVQIDFDTELEKLRLELREIRGAYKLESVDASHQSSLCYISTADTSRHYYPVDVIKQVIDSMSFAKLNVLHWHIIDEQSFPLEIPSYPNLWKGSYSKLERYTVEDAQYIVSYAKKRGIHVMAEIDVPGHAESWGNGYPKLWPSPSCTEPLDVSSNFTFEVISGILSDMRKIFPFGMFHLGGDEVYTGCWNVTPHVKQWLDERNMTTKDAYKYFVLRAQEIAIHLNWTPVNWEETFNSFGENLNPLTVVHNWLGPGVCPKVVAKGLRCIMSNQGAWYLDHLDVPWEEVYAEEPLAGISDAAQQKLVLGGEVCMWGETADTSDALQTIWPRAAAAAERMWSPLEAISDQDLETTVLSRLHYFRCLLNHRGIAAAPVTNFYARRPPIGPGSCFIQ
ncbi:beta-hexosaminidase 1-like [Lolium rigidum]|uniref:beta-hexosaminidase 1-like n=1 Tax=Lolium rigidum TaxID=89674 RepID=UPI001F5D3D24|nr:beta-hexosaminidase 1-like [Lolium rigidum]